MDLRMTDRAVAVPRIREIVWNLRGAWGILAVHSANVAVALDTKLRHVTALEQFRVCGTVRVVTRRTTFDF